jgi:O-antigen ligase
MPQLALFVCTIYVLFLLKLERRQSPHVSRALWIPTIWMLYAASKPLGTWLGSGDWEAGSPLDQYFLSVLLFLGVWILSSRNFLWSRAVEENPWLMLLMGYMLVSILWSDIPFIAFKRWIREMIAVVMAFLILSERYPRQAMQSLFKRTIYILIPFSLILIKYFPQYGIQYRNQGGPMWVGVATQKNSFGRLCLSAAFFFVWTLIRRWKGHDIPVGKYQTLADVSVFVLTLYLLTGPPGEDQYSATALVSLGVGLLTFYVLLRKKPYGKIIGANTLMVMMALIMGLGILQPFWGGSTVTGFTSNLGRDTTLTGRTEIWASLVPDVLQQPILGSGFGSFWTSTIREVHNIGEAHNGYLDVVLSLGFVGLALWGIFLLSCCRKAHRVLFDDRDWGSLWICFLFMALIHNFTETSFGSFTTLLPAILLFLPVTSTATSTEEKGGGRRGDRG